MPAEFFPWSLLLPTRSILAGWKRLGRAASARASSSASAGSVVTLVFFSVSPAKRSVYVLTMYPALALLAGAGLDRLAAEWPAWRRWLVAPLGLIGRRSRC